MPAVAENKNNASCYIKRGRQEGQTAYRKMETGERGRDFSPLFCEKNAGFRRKFLKGNMMEAGLGERKKEKSG